MMDVEKAIVFVEMMMGHLAPPLSFGERVAA
jgi:hypothetical protein